MRTVRLGHTEWHEIYSAQVAQIEKSILSDEYISAWTAEMEKLTRPGDKVIETGMALGVTSLYLAKRGRLCTGLDYSQEMCDLFVQTGGRLGLDVKAVCADMLQKLPFGENEFDVVFHAGVIEHFSDEEVQFIISENARIAKGRVICMAPNANSLAYIVGKEWMEKNGKWPYGEENPKHTLRDVFIQAGLGNIREYSIDYASALNFLPEGELRAALTSLYTALPVSEGDGFQGYLLVTIGEKIGAPGGIRTHNL